MNTKITSRLRPAPPPTRSDSPVDKPIAVSVYTSDAKALRPSVNHNRHTAANVTLPRMPRMGLINIILFLKLGNGFDRMAFSGIASAAHALGDTLIYVCGEDTSIADGVRRYEADGVIVSTDRQAMIDDVVASGKPCVNITNHLQGHRLVPVVGNDDTSIGKLAAQHYLDRGFRHFAYFSNSDNPYFNPRRDSFVQTLQAAGVGCAIGPTAAQNSRPEQSTEHAGRWLASLPRPLAVMTAWDFEACEAILACRSAGLRVPEDVSVIGVDNDETLCLAIWPHLSSIATPAKRIGFEALRLLRDMITNKTPPPPEPVLFASPEVIVRGSSSETAVDDPEVAMAMNFIQSHLAHRLSVTDLVEHTAISRRALERRFLKALGRTPMEEIRRARVERAKRLLIETDLSLAEVARRSGLVRQQRLCSVLKADTGRTPLQFRSSARPEEK